MRLSGLASGMDTDTMVKQMMKIERMKVDRVEQNRQTILWRQEQYNSVNKQLANFILNTQKDIGLKKTSSTGTMLSGSYKNLDYVKKAESSNENVATVTSTGVTTNGSFEIDVAKGGVPRNATFTSAKVSDENLKGVKELTFKINGHYVTVLEKENKSDLTMDDVVRAVNSAKVRTYNGVEITVKNEDGKAVQVAGDKIITEAQQKDIKETPLGVNAFYDKGTGRMFFEASEGSKVANNGDFKIKIEGAAGLAHGFSAAMNGSPGVEGEEIKDHQSLTINGSRGSVTINGVSVDTKNGKVNFNGLSIDIKAEGTTRINVSTNTQGIMEKIEKLVADYNELVDTVSGLTGEKVYSGYKPLSSEERKAMNEDDLKLWDEKAKSGLLNRDSTLERTLQSMRTDIYKTLEGATGSYSHITEIGISTEKYSQGSAGGKLEINTEKLRKAIEEDAEGVMELLFKEGNLGKDGKEIFEAGSGINNPSTKGVFTRVYDDLMDGMKAIIDKSGPGQDQALFRGIKSNMLIDFITKKGSISDLDKSVLDMNKQIDNLNILLARKEDAHYAKFAAMEKQMYQMQNQSGWLAQQFQY